MCSLLVSWIDLNMDTDSQSQVCDSTVVEHSLGLAIKHTFELIFRVTAEKRLFHQKTRDIMILFVVKNIKIRFWAVHITQNKLWPYWQYYRITSTAPNRVRFFNRKSHEKLNEKNHLRSKISSHFTKNQYFSNRSKNPFSRLILLSKISKIIA